MEQRQTPLRVKKTNDPIDLILKQLGADDYYNIEAHGPQARRQPEVSRQEGQLSVDVAETPEHMVVITTIAGVQPDDIELAVSPDMLTIRGQRERGIALDGGTMHLAECYWGVFSRTIILPQAVKPEGTRALFKNGVLIITMPKERPGASVPIIVVEED